jgi:hypothetical protein
MRRCRIALLTLSLLATSACSHPGQHVDKNEQLAALDEAYQANLLTKDEYDAKKLAITGVSPFLAPASASAPAADSSESSTPLVLASQPKAQKASSPPRGQALASATGISATSSAPPVAVSPKESAPPPINLHSNEPAPLAGCADAEYKSGGQKGTEERFFAASPDTVRNAALSALDSLDFNIHKKSNKEIEASKKRHLGAIVGAGGELVVLTFEPSKRGDTSGTRVTGRTKKHIVGYMAQRTWTDAVLAEMACKLSASGH